VHQPGDLVGRLGAAGREAGSGAAGRPLAAAMACGLQGGRTGMKLQGKAALVTGASRGLGRAIAVGLAREGARVGVHYRGSAQEAEAAVREIEALGGEAVALEADVRDKAQVEAMFQQFLERFGQLDILVNNAGIM